MGIKIVLFDKINCVRLQNIIKLFSPFSNLLKRAQLNKLFIMILNLNQLKIPN